MEKAIIDTQLWVGYHWDKDQWHIPSRTIIDAFLNGNIWYVYITDYVIVETINFLLRKAHYEAAKNALNAFRGQRARVYYVDAVLFAKACALFEQYPGLSITDASLVALAQEQNIKTIFSFDTVFDKVKGIERKEDYYETDG